jgi:hypothetical protein
MYKNPLVKFSVAPKRLYPLYHLNLTLSIAIQVSLAPLLSLWYNKYTVVKEKNIMPKYIADEVIRDKDGPANDGNHDYSYRGNVLFFENGSISRRDAIDYEYEYFATPEEAEEWAIKTADLLNKDLLSSPIADVVEEKSNNLTFYLMQLSVATNEDEIAFWEERISMETGIF